MEKAYFIFLLVDEMEVSEGILKEGEEVFRNFIMQGIWNFNVY